MRIFFDTSYTRTQTGNMGITRTVRRLLEEWQRALPDEVQECIAVAYNSRGFREVPMAEAAVDARPVPPASKSMAAQVFRWVTSELFRRIVIACLFIPWPILRRVWASTSSWTFNALSHNGQQVQFKSGDILFLCDASWNYPVWYAVRLAREQGAKVVLLMYDLIPLRHPEFCFALVPHIFQLWLSQMLRLADAVVCISGATERDLRDYARDTHMSLPPTGYFHLGSDPVRANPGGEVRPSLEQFFTGSSSCFVGIGSFEPKKNYDFLLDVFERMWARGLKVRLLIIGRESAESHALIKRVRQHPEQGKKLLTLFDATDSEVAFSYVNCRALIFPSLAEGFGLPLVEARTRGSLVIASDLPAFVELADDGVHIYSGGSHDELEAVIARHAQTDYRSQISLRPPFLWRDSAKQCKQLFERLLTQEKMH